MADFIQLNFKNQITGAAINTILLQADEVPNGLARNEAREPSPNYTTMGKVHSFPKAVPLYFAFNIIFDEAETAQKLDLIQQYIELGYIADVQHMTGTNVYSSGSNSMQYSVTKATLLNCAIAEFDAAWRVVNPMGTRARVEVPIKFVPVGGNALPLAANWVGF